jgi:hypothetical protein
MPSIHEVVRTETRFTFRGGLKRTHYLRREPLAPGYKKDVWYLGMEGRFRKIAEVVDGERIRVKEYEINPDDCDLITEKTLTGFQINKDSFLREYFRFYPS